MIKPSASVVRVIQINLLCAQGDFTARIRLNLFHFNEHIGIVKRLIQEMCCSWFKSIKMCDVTCGRRWFVCFQTLMKRRGSFLALKMDLISAFRFMCKYSTQGFWLVQGFVMLGEDCRKKVK